MKVDPVAWVEDVIEPRWFGLWHRRAYYVCTRFARMRAASRAEAELAVEVLLSRE